MWFLKLFIVVIGLGLIYMIITQETIQIGPPGHKRSWSLWDHPVRYIITFASMVIFEWFLIKVYLKDQEEEKSKKKRRKNKEKKRV